MTITETITTPAKVTERDRALALACWNIDKRAWTVPEFEPVIANFREQAVAEATRELRLTLTAASKIISQLADDVMELIDAAASRDAEITRLKEWNAETVGKLTCSEQRLATRIAFLEDEKASRDALIEKLRGALAYLTDLRIADESGEHTTPLAKDDPRVLAVTAAVEAEESSVGNMSLFDVLEMLMDWKAATERMKDGGDIHRSLVLNTERFKLSPQLANILANTIREMKW